MDGKILIATFSPWKQDKRLPTNGNVEPMIDCFAPTFGKTVIIDQPYPGSDRVMPRIEVYKGTKKGTIFSSSVWLFFLYLLLRITNRPGTRVMFKLRDFLSVIGWCLKERERYDYFIGLESINAYAGILMKKIGFIETVVYYVSDFSPVRYANRYVNACYLWLDRQCAMHADYIWDVSKAMHPARIRAGLDPQKSAPVIHVPNALYPRQIHSVSAEQVVPYTVVYVGTLGYENGPDIAIEAMKQVRTSFPQSVLHIIGGDENLEKLKRLASGLGLEHAVTFHGYISDREEISERIRRYALALAPYRAISSSPRLFGDATKIRLYAGCGLPIITTAVPPIGRDVETAGGAIIVRDNPRSFAKAIIQIFSDSDSWQSLRRGSILYAQGNTWQNVYKEAFHQMQKEVR